MLLSEGGHIAHLTFFGYQVEAMAKSHLLLCDCRAGSRRSRSKSVPKEAARPKATRIESEGGAAPALPRRSNRNAPQVDCLKCSDYSPVSLQEFSLYRPSQSLSVRSCCPPWRAARGAAGRTGWGAQGLCQRRTDRDRLRRPSSGERNPSPTRGMERSHRRVNFAWWKPTA